MADRRPDPTTTSKKTYSKKQFQDFYGPSAGAMWKKAGKALAKAEGGGGGAEKRRDPTTPKSKKTYTKAEFTQFYGKKHGAQMWQQAGGGSGKKKSGKKEAKGAKAAAPPRPKMRKVTLKYWNGRGLMEVPRMMLALRGKKAGEDFVDGRYVMEGASGNAKLFDEVKDSLAANLGRMPTCDVGESTKITSSIGQSAAINFYLASELGFLGKNSLEAARIIAVQEHVKEMMTAYRGIVPYGQDPTEEALNKWFATGSKDSTGAADGKGRAERFLPWWLGRIEAVVGDDGCAVGRRLSLADLLLYNTLAEALKEEDRAESLAGKAYVCEPMGSQAKMDKALLDAPKIAKILVAVGGNKKLQAYLAGRGKQNF